MKKKIIFGLSLLTVLSCKHSSEKDVNANNKLQETFNKRDKNNNNILEKNELIGIVSNDFSKVDKDKNGVLNLEEFKDALALKNSKPNHGRMHPNPEDIFTELDSNNDLKISDDEAKGPLKDDFLKIDKDQDGFITIEELEQTPRSGKKHQKENTNN